MQRLLFECSAVLAWAALGVIAAEQPADNRDFKALPRPIHYETPLAPKEGVKAVIVYGRDAPWTKTAGEAVQKAVQEWSGVKALPGFNGFGLAGNGVRLANLIPGEPEVLATMQAQAGVDLWSARRNSDGGYIKIGNEPPVIGTYGGSFAWIQKVVLPGHKGLLGACQNGITYYPIASPKPNGKDQHWEFSTGGVPAVAGLLEGLNGDGASEVLLARVDGFVNVLNVADGASLGTIKTGEPIIGMAMLRGKHRKPLLAVGAKFGVHLFGSDLKEIGSHTLSTPAAGFAGPGGKERDRVYVVAADGQVTVLVLR